MINTTRMLFISIPFIWCGMLVGISFIEAPIKFRAPGVTRSIGVGIGQLVFNALNKIEWIFCISWLLSFYIGKKDLADLIIPSTICLLLFLQTCWIMPHLKKRVVLLREGLQSTRRSLHPYYIIGEVLKVSLLAGSGFSQLYRVIK